MPNVSDNNFDQHFRDQLGNLSSTPSDRNWMAIERQLPVAERKKMNWWWVFPVVMMLGFTAGAIWYLDALEDRKEWQAAQLIPGGTFDATMRIDLPVFNRLVARQAAGSPLYSFPVSGQRSVVAAMVPSTQRNQQESGVFAPEPRTTASSENKPFGFLMNSLQADVLSTSPVKLNPIFYDTDRQLRPQAIAGLRIGPMAMAQLTGFSGSQVTQPFADKNYLPTLTAGAAYGLALHYDMNSRWGITMEAIISSAEGQRFSYSPVANTMVPEQLSYQVATNYLRLPVMLKYRGEMLRNVSPNPVLWNLQAGMVYGRLNWVNLDDAGQLVMSRDINSHELGIALGASADWYIGKNYVWTVGARFSAADRLSGRQSLSGVAGSWQTGLYTQLNWLLSGR